MRISDWSSDVCSSDLGTNVSIQLLDDQSTESAEAFTVQINGAQLAVSGTQLQIFDASGTGTIAASDKVLLYDTTAFGRSEEHTSELQSLIRISYAVFCLKKKKTI